MTIDDLERGGSADAPSLSEPMFDAVRRGYNPRQVQEYVRAMTDRLQILENRTSELESELDQARAQATTSATSPNDPLEVVPAHVADVVRAFDQDVVQMRHNAEAEVQRIVDEAKRQGERAAQVAEKVRSKGAAEVEGMLANARSEADRIRVDAQANAEAVRAEAERVLEDAQVRADAAISELEARRESLVVEIRTLHDRMLESARGLEPVMEADSAPGEVAIVHSNPPTT